MLNEEIREKTEGLYYISETDAPIVLFAGGQADRITAEILAENIVQTNNNEDTEKEDAEKKILEISLDEFFNKLTRVRDGAGEREIEYAGRFRELRELLESNLHDLKVFKTGEYSQDIFIVGLDQDNNLTGVRTRGDGNLKFEPVN